MKVKSESEVTQSCPTLSNPMDCSLPGSSIQGILQAGVLEQWTWVWVNSGSWWWTGRPGVLRFVGSERVGHDWATELNWIIISHQLVYFSSVEFLGFYCVYLLLFACLFCFCFLHFISLQNTTTIFTSLKIYQALFFKRQPSPTSLVKRFLLAINRLYHFLSFQALSYFCVCVFINDVKFQMVWFCTLCFI